MTKGEKRICQLMHRHGLVEAGQRIRAGHARRPSATSAEAVAILSDTDRLGALLRRDGTI
jgi:hypothetical protein